MYIRFASSLRIPSFPLLDQHPKLLFAALFILSFGALFTSFSLLNWIWSERPSDPTTEKTMLLASDVIRTIETERRITLTPSSPLRFSTAEVSNDLAELAKIEPSWQFSRLMFRLLMLSKLEVTEKKPHSLQISLDPEKNQVELSVTEEITLDFAPFKQRTIRPIHLYRQMLMRNIEEVTFDPGQILCFPFPENPPATAEILMENHRLKVEGGSLTTHLDNNSKPYAKLTSTTPFKIKRL